MCTGVNAVKVRIVLLAIAFVVSGCPQQIDNPPDVGTNVALEEALESMRTGVGQNAVMVEVGNFLLLKRDGPDVAVKIIEHTRPSFQTDKQMQGATYECFVFEDDDYSRFKKYAGEVFEAEVDSNDVYDVCINCGTFGVEWSLGDWLYFDDSITAMARTDKTDIKDVSFADKKLKWHFKKKAASHWSLD